MAKMTQAETWQAMIAKAVELMDDEDPDYERFHSMDRLIGEYGDQAERVNRRIHGVMWRKLVWPDGSEC